jgi:hypothetical protein
MHSYGPRQPSRKPMISVPFASVIHRVGAGFSLPLNQNR